MYKLFFNYFRIYIIYYKNNKKYLKIIIIKKVIFRNFNVIEEEQ